MPQAPTTKKNGNGHKPTVEERLERIEKALGLGAEDVPQVPALPGEPRKTFELYVTDPEAAEELAKERVQQAKDAEKAAKQAADDAEKQAANG